MNRIRALGTLTSVICLLAGLTGGAYLGPRPSLDELIAEAETIFFGEVVDVRSYWESHEHGRAIVSRAMVRVVHTFKGRPATSAELEYLGGTIGDVTLSVSDVPQLHRGDRDVLFVNSTGRPITPIVRAAYGRFRVVTDPATGVEIVRTHAGVPILGLAALAPTFIAPRRPMSWSAGLHPAAPTWRLR